MIGNILRSAALLSFSLSQSHLGGPETGGKRGLISGGAHSIGRVATAKFVGHCAKVAIANIQEQNGRELADELGSSAAFMRCNVSHESDFSDAVDFAVSSMAASMSIRGVGSVQALQAWFAVPTKFVMEELKMMLPCLDDSHLMKIIRNSGVLKGANCETDNIANAALFLASDVAKYVNGHNLTLDGGFTVMTNLEIPAPEDV
ncbi:hypothetical protein MLD38_033032 [Melastoma candidum]|uniref:Uncharacterized protein n=1 Tax=Melastoma candidum TaxID=119954 RepID=A0ACB9M5L2_9MYRT|nr:hypothetical protein MLD38_033032 [Melastoma candidum]